MHLEGLKQGSGDGERALGSSKPVRTAGRQILRQGRVFMKIILITVVGKKLFGAVKITPFKNSSKIGKKQAVPVRHKDFVKVPVWRQRGSKSYLGKAHLNRAPPNPKPPFP